MNFMKLFLIAIMAVSASIYAAENNDAFKTEAEEVATAFLRVETEEDALVGKAFVQNTEMLSVYLNCLQRAHGYNGAIAHLLSLGASGDHQELRAVWAETEAKIRTCEQNKPAFVDIKNLRLKNQ